MMPLGEAFYRRRIAVIKAALADKDLDGLLLLDPYNLMYAAGFIHIESERPIGFYIPAADAPILFVPLLEAENAACVASRFLADHPPERRILRI